MQSPAVSLALSLSSGAQSSSSSVLVFSPRYRSALALSSPSLPSSASTVATTTAPSTARAHSTSGVQSVVAGVVAGCVTRSCTSPLDVLKILIQVNGSVSRSAAVAVEHSRSLFANASATLHARASSSSAGISATVRHLYAHEGPRGFWKGNLAGCCRLGPYAGAKFFLFDSLQARFLDETSTNLHRALCGAVAGLIATMGTYPMEVIRTRIITQTAQTPSYLRINGVAHGLQVILRHEGVRGLYKGGWSGIIGAIPFEGVQFGCYEYLKHSCRTQQWPAFRWTDGKDELDGIDYFVCGSIAGAIAQTAAYPFDTVKKRLQTQHVVAAARASGRDGVLALGSGSEPMYYRGMVDCFQKVIREEGVHALYRGTLPNLVRVVPYAAIMFSTYELAKQTLGMLCEP
ncbi:hypothetical protein Poli38472_011925 [Pythium oligandrum]|uniref:Mitochondrial carrier protein n=1 Tax=Pythium oligandrum TaxID=41045 RepID=A0A8K1FG49_PYTOL|nr:hypothetical protein Poli38472_011925 [Pythium oligandrum]|eukprot:TMW58337.1 hypothetical protein Poli38472_011925 [Pythium oligandrum]